MAGKKDIRLSSASRKVLDALAETIIPSEEDRPGALDTEMVDRLLEWLGQVPGVAGAFVAYCWLWELTPLFAGKFSRLSRLSLEERTEVLEGWEHSGLMLRRYTLLSIKGIFMAVFYNDPAVWKEIGYEPGCLSDPPEPVKTRC